MRFIIRGVKKEEAGRKFARGFSAFSRDWLGGGIQRKKKELRTPPGGKGDNSPSNVDNYLQIIGRTRLWDWFFFGCGYHPAIVAEPPIYALLIS